MSREVLCVVKTIVGCVLAFLGLYVVCVCCYIYTKPWQIQIPQFNCSLIRTDSARVFLSDMDGRWSVGSNILLIDVTETLLYGLIMDQPAFNRLDYLQEPSFFVLEKGKLPKDNLSYADFVAFLRAHAILSIDLQPPFCTDTKKKIEGLVECKKNF